MIALRSMRAKWKWPPALKKTLLYRILIIGIVVLSSLYLIDYTTSHISDLSVSKLLKRPGLLLSKEEDYSDEVEEVIDENYFVKTPGCRIVKMEVMSDQIRSFIPSERPKEINCGGIPALTDSDENFLWINLTETDLKKFYNVTVDQMQCYYTPFTRVTDYLALKNETLTLLNYGHRTKIDSEYIQVFCENSNQTQQIYVDFHTFFPQSVRNENEEKEKYNVMILGIDSLSKLNFHRMLNLTSKTLIEDLDAIELHGYNKVDDNTYPNLIPMLTGLSSEELNGACLLSNASLHFDSCHYIWDDFKKKSYSTLFAEDSAALGLFNYFKNGFDKQPTDFYLRTIIYQMEKEIAYNKIGNYKLCLGHRRPIDFFLKEYIHKFVKSMANTPTFSFFWTSSMTHDYINYPMLIDEDLSNLLVYMKGQKYLDKTILFILADHGLRFGSFRQTFQGMVEERLPFFFAIFPKSFKQKYPLAIRNFKRNARRLTTHYDIFETLRDISELESNSITNENLKRKTQDLKERNTERLPRGISLFLEVPETRTCDSAGIESHWCMCYEKLELSNLDQRVQKAARFILKSINDIVKPHNKSCHSLYLNSVVNAHMHMLNENVFNPPNREKIKSLRPPKGRKKIYDVTLKITTKPGPRAEFEATVRIDEINDEMKISGIISRLTTYTKGCIKDSFVEKYCFCDPI